MSDSIKPEVAAGQASVLEGYVSQEEVNRIVAGERRKIEEKFNGKLTDYEQVKSKLAEFEQAAASSKSEAEQYKDSLAKLEERVTQLDSSLLEARLAEGKARVAAVKGVPVELITGSTVEEFEVSAEALVAFREKGAGAAVEALKTESLGTEESSSKSVAGDFDSGKELFESFKH